MSDYGSGLFKQVTSGVSGFVADMRAQNIHVGMGSNPTCVTCGEPWPCTASTVKS